MTRRFALTIILIVTLAAASVFPAFGLSEKDAETVIHMKPGINKIEINGRSYTAESPVKERNTLFVPIRLILEAFGAEVNWEGEGRINIVYRGYSIDLTVDKSNYLINQEENQLSQPPRYKNNTVMVPLDFVEKYFDIGVSTDAATGIVTITLEDDGALTDLSFLIGSISASKIGNSYFGWSIDVPRGSRLGYTTFNSKYLHVENEQREMSIEIYIDSNIEESLEEFYENNVTGSDNYFRGEAIDCSLELGRRYKYIEVLYINNYDEAVIQRMYKSGKNMISVVLTSYSEMEPERLKQNKFYTDLLDSFRMGYKGLSSDVQDLSKVEFGFAEYENYINGENFKKYLSWEMKVLPEWDILESQTDNPYSTTLGMSEKEYIAVEIKKLESSSEFDEYIDKINDLYKDNFNPKYYESIKNETGNLGGRKSHKIVYKLVIGKNTYVVDENFVAVGDLLYNITIKSPEERYSHQKTTYYKMLDSFGISPKEQQNLKDSLDDYNYSVNRNRIGKNDDISQYISDRYAWELKLPGYWLKNSTYDTGVQTFYNNRSGASILVEVIDNETFSKTADDREKFTFLSGIISQNAELIKEETLSFKGYNVKSYSYRVENEEEDFYMNFQVYIVNTGKYSYCYISAISDVCTSETNLKELQEIWDSFTPVTVVNHK